MAARKKPTIPQLVNKAATLLQKKVRLKYADDNGMVNCVTCGTPKKWNDGIQGGHYISRTYMATKLLEENIHPQCQWCNGFKGGNLSAYAVFMLDTYGPEFLKELEQLKRQPKKYTRPEIEEIIETLKTEVKELEKEKGL